MPDDVVMHVSWPNELLLVTSTARYPSHNSNWFVDFALLTGETGRTAANNVRPVDWDLMLEDS